MVIHDDESDDSLMEKAAAGNTAAFDRIVRRHQHRLQRFATRMLGGDSARGADVAVGAFLRLWESRGTFRSCGQLGAWLLKSAYRQCLDLLGERIHEPLDADFGTPGESLDARVEKTALAQAVRDAVMELPQSHRAVLVLSVYEGMSYDAIAAALEIPAGTVASRKNHAISILRGRLAAWNDDLLELRP